MPSEFHVHEGGKGSQSSTVQIRHQFRVKNEQCRGESAAGGRRDFVLDRYTSAMRKFKQNTDKSCEWTAGKEMTGGGPRRDGKWRSAR